MNESNEGNGVDGRVSKRRFLNLMAGAAATPTVASALIGSARADQTASNQSANVQAGNSMKGHNILFIFTDQERYMPKWLAGLSLPGHERLQKMGTTFHNHYCPATMCTSSRSVLLTGLQTPDTRMFENTNVPWVRSMSTDIPTIGHMLRKADYYTAYKGKWHLTRSFDMSEPDHLFTEEMEEYGFADFFSPGDIIGHTLGGYQFDHLIAGSAITWMRRKGRPLNDEGKPWCLTVSLVNPHDIMYFNADAPGESVQDTGNLLMHAARAPEHDFYKATWDMPLADSLQQPVDAPGRPRAHLEFQKMWGYTLGNVPLEEKHWRRFLDFYVNSIRSVDQQIANILGELDALGLTDRTIVVFTSDHGEMAGSHGLRGKGPFAYEQCIHLPMYMVHPDVKGGQGCQALTGHIDLAPTFLAMAGASKERSADLAGRALPGRELTGLLSNPGAAGLHDARESVLYTYSGLAANDSDLTRMISEAVAGGKDPKVALVKSGFLPDLKKRGSLRTVFDGRYKFTRYFSPLERNRPSTFEDLYRWNDVELFDLQEDPGEMVNRAADEGADRDLVLAMNDKLETIIKAEIGEDDGREMPNIPFVDWAVERFDIQ